MKFNINFEAISEQNVQATNDFVQEHGLGTESKSIPQYFCLMLDSCSEMVGKPLTAKFVRSIIRMFNFLNYFKITDKELLEQFNDEILPTMNFKTLEEFIDKNWPKIEPDVKAGVVVTKAKRREQWFKRARPYLMSHIVGNSDTNSLNKDKRFKYKAVYDEGAETVTFTLKTEPKKSK